MTDELFPGPGSESSDEPGMEPYLEPSPHLETDGIGGTGEIEEPEVFAEDTDEPRISPERDRFAAQPGLPTEGQDVLTTAAPASVSTEKAQGFRLELARAVGIP